MWIVVYSPGNRLPGKRLNSHSQLMQSVTCTHIYFAVWTPVPTQKADFGRPLQSVLRPSP